MKRKFMGIVLQCALFAALLLAGTIQAFAQDLAEIRERGVIRHLGVPYANFITSNGRGFDAELVQLFAQKIGVRYEYVDTDWYNLIQDLIGQNVEYNPVPHALGSRQIRGDIIASGLTVLASREPLLDYSHPTFPSAVWLIARSDTKVKPIVPTGNLDKDIKATKAKLHEGTTFVMDNYCIDPKLHDLEGKGYRLLRFSTKRSLNDIVPAVLKRESDMTLLDVPDIMVSMGKWSAQIKVIGPISKEQQMAAAFRKTSPELRRAFDDFLDGIKSDGTYMKLVRKHYKSAPRYLPEFFQDPLIKH